MKVLCINGSRSDWGYFKPVLKEISKKESYLFSYLTFLTLVLGIYPNLVLDSLYFSIKALNNN